MNSVKIKFFGIGIEKHYTKTITNIIVYNDLGCPNQLGIPQVHGITLALL